MKSGCAQVWDSHFYLIQPIENGRKYSILIEESNLWGLHLCRLRIRALFDNFKSSADLDECFNSLVKVLTVMGC